MPDRGQLDSTGSELNSLPEIQLSLASVQVDPGAGPANHQSRAQEALSNGDYSGIDCAFGACIAHDQLCPQRDRGKSGAGRRQVLVMS